MKTATQEKSLRREYFHYLFPSIASMVSLSCYILADTYFVSAGVGSLGLAGLNIALPAYSLINALGLMLGIGAGVVVSVSRGQGDERKANSVFGCAVAVGLAVGLVLTAVGVTQAEGIATLLGASKQSLPYAATYLRTITAFSVFFLLNNILVALVRNDGNPRLSMVAMVICSLSNVALDALFILGFGWRMFGAAFATGLAPIISIAILSLHWIKGKAGLRLEKKRPQLSLLPTIVKGGSANFITEMGNGVVILLFNLTLASLGGDLAVAAYGIVANIALVIANLFVGIGQGMQPVCSRCHGEGNVKGTGQLLRLAMGISLGLGVLFLIAGEVFPAQLAAVFNSKGDAELAALTIRAIRFYFAAFPFMGINLSLTAWMQSVMRTRPAGNLSLLRAFVLVVAGILLLPRMMGLDGVWLIVPIAEALTLLAGVATILLSRSASAKKTNQTA